MARASTLSTSSSTLTCSERERPPSMIAPESRRWLGRLVRFAVSASLIAWLLTRADVASIGAVLRNAEWLLLAAAFASYFVGYAVKF